MKFQAKINDNGTGFDFGDGIERFKSFAEKNKGRRVTIEPHESVQQRRFFEGAVIPLFAYLDGHDYRDSHVLKYLRDNYIKPEFHGEIVVVNGKQIKVGKSTKGELHQVADKVIDWLEEQYGIDRDECLNPKDYKHFRDVVFMNGGYESYIDYLVSLKKLPVVYLRKNCG